MYVIRYTTGMKAEKCFFQKKEKENKSALLLTDCCQISLREKNKKDKGTLNQLLRNCHYLTYLP